MAGLKAVLGWVGNPVPHSFLVQDTEMSAPAQLLILVIPVLIPADDTAAGRAGGNGLLQMKFDWKLLFEIGIVLLSSIDSPRHLMHSVGGQI